MLRCVGNPRGALSIHISCKALSGASSEIRIRECAASFCLEGGIPGTDGNAALVLFCGTQGGREKERSYMGVILSLIGGLLKMVWKITKFLCKPAWEGLKDICKASKASWELYKVKKAQKAASADNSAESKNLSAEGASETKDHVGDSESSDSNA